jgi:hypothetical protein
VLLLLAALVLLLLAAFMLLLLAALVLLLLAFFWFIRHDVFSWLFIKTAVMTLCYCPSVITAL